MKKKILVLLIIAGLMACSSSESFLPPPITEEIDIPDDTDTDEEDDDSDSTTTEVQNFKLLSLGDSYTIGQSVCSTCKFPEQLKDSLSSSLENTAYELTVIAQTGWTTTDLIDAVESIDPSNDFDLVTLLIGVNNQFTNRPFELYESEFANLVNKAISYGTYNSENVIVVSIPDYAFTPFGQNFGNPEETSSEIEQYNDFAEAYCAENGISYVYITDITQLGLENTELVASDGLHPSELAYSLFVERILPIAIEKLD